MGKPGSEENAKETAKPICFVIMPVSDPDNYGKGHFRHVYDDILAPACDQAGFTAVRADKIKESNLIHLDILQKLLDAPMAVCDLSSHNPNVLFELALRQAFDKPVALVQETGTPQVFDISPIRYTEYRKERVYHEVLEDQTNIASAVRETFEAHRTGKSVNSIVKLLALSKPATIPDINAPEASANILQLILSELGQLRQEVHDTRRQVITQRDHRERSLELARLREMLSDLEHCVLGFPVNPDALGKAQVLYANCRSILSTLIRDSADISEASRARIADIGRKLEMLGVEVGRAAEGAQSPQKK